MDELDRYIEKYYAQEENGEREENRFDVFDQFVIIDEDDIQSAQNSVVSPTPQSLAPSATSVWRIESLF